MDKALLRQEFIKRRSGIPPSTRAEKSAKIHQQLIDSVDWTQVHRMHIYRSITKWGEVDTLQLIDKITTFYPGISIDIASQSSTLLPTVATKYDMIIVPVLAYDYKGSRLGMGAGWYDRFLMTQPQAIKIGLAYRESRADHIPTETHDIALDKIISA